MTFSSRVFAVRMSTERRQAAGSSPNEPSASIDRYPFSTEMGVRSS